MNDIKTAASIVAAAEVPVATITHVPSRDDHYARGKALREKLPRKSQGLWKAHDNRADPIALLRASDADRIQELVPIRYGRMLQSPFTFYRGSAAVMASDLAATPNTGIRVQACGDCHLANFGGFATPERNIIFDINDFDETLPAPWEWDVKRLVASIVLAGRSLGLSDAKARHCAIACAAAYRERLNASAKMDPLEAWYQKVTSDDVIGTLSKAHRKRAQERVDQAAASNGSELDFPKLAEPVGGKVRIREQPPLIYHPEEAKTAEFQTLLNQVLRDYRKTLSDDRRLLLDRYQLLDAAIKVVGMVLQFKEAVPSVLEPYAGESAYGHHGERVVMGQRFMQPVSDIFLGWVTGPNGRQFYIRQLRDAKIKPLIETFDGEFLEAYAISCGWVLARAHAKVGEITTIAGYLGSSDVFDEAMGRFGVAYADQAERDHSTLKAAVRKGKITIFKED